MTTSPFFLNLLIVLPCLLMVSCAAFTSFRTRNSTNKWSALKVVNILASLASGLSLLILLSLPGLPSNRVLNEGAFFELTLSGAWIALLVQLLGCVIAIFSEKYLQGERRQQAYIFSIAAVLASVQLLIVSNNWWVLIGAWSVTGIALDGLLRFYPERPFAVLAAHKKMLSDRFADLLLISSASVAYAEIGTSSLSVYFDHIDANGASMFSNVSAVLLVLAVITRMALLPVHGWLIQVMEAPTPVSALLHAGVVNLGGFVLIKFAPLLEASEIARWLLIAFGLFSAFFAGFVMLTRVSIKVRLAWSTLAQMGFMAVECGVGMYELAMLHLIGHSLYKAHSFLMAGNVVNDVRIKSLRSGGSGYQIWSLMLAPFLSSFLVLFVLEILTGSGLQSWPWWWSVLIAVAWAPLFWVKNSVKPNSNIFLVVTRASLITVVLTGIAWSVHHIPFGIRSAETYQGFWLVLAVMLMIYLLLAILQVKPIGLRIERLRRIGYAGLYLDDWYTRLVMVAFPPRLPVEPSDK
jgi:NAD(P)H-quinone oxidoreductase subunit 5